MDFMTGIDIAASGMTAQTQRIRIIAQNIANADSAATAPGQDPYRRQQITFKNVFDPMVGDKVVKVASVTNDQSEFRRKFDPSHPAADATGYISLPNVNPIIETADLQEASRSYQASLSAMDLLKTMASETIKRMSA